MSALTYQRLRIALDQQDPNPAIDQSTGGQPVIWRGNDILFEFAVYDHGQLADISAITSVVMSVKPKPNITDAAILTKTVTTGFTADLTDVQWIEGSRRHFSIAVTAAESALLAVSPELAKDYWIVLRALCASTTTQFTLCTATLTVKEDGH